ncbi:MAG: PilX N-terminal domain-containing pilus assembly protein [Aquabacterium sp.]|nr:PilX N-terminal domain-containing pilus assembly protein [Aquabacterium sp.]
MAPRRGVAALTVVMILFVVMAMVAAYPHRNLVFEQRISANSYRSNRALEAADAGVEWTVAMLNAGRVDGNCQPSVNPAFGDFRSRYLEDSNDETNGEGGYALEWGATLANRVYPACIIRDGALSCVCPSMGGAVADIGAPADGIGSAFRIAFILPGNAVRAGAMEFASRGCANPGAGASACFAQTHDVLPTVDGLSGALTTVGLVRALPIPPKAALTAGGAVSVTAGELRVRNPDNNSGLTVHAGGDLTSSGSGTFALAGPAGSGSDGRLTTDATLSALAAQPNEAWFRALFGMDSATYQRQPAVVRVDCAAGCTLATLNNTLAGYPRNPIWVNGNLNIDAVANLGSAVDPLMLIVTGTLTVSANATVRGFVHANDVVWSSAATLEGALVSATTFTASAVATLSYDRSMMDIIRLRYGSFVRTPGSWNLTVF